MLDTSPAALIDIAPTVPSWFGIRTSPPSAGPEGRRQLPSDVAASGLAAAPIVIAVPLVFLATGQLLLISFASRPDDHVSADMDKDGYKSRLTIDPGKRRGKPCIRGSRITVYDILEYLASGMSEEAVLADFPELEPEDIRASLMFAADRERRLLTDEAA